MESLSGSPTTLDGSFPRRGITPDSFTIQVNEVNNAPVITQVVPATIEELAPWTLSVEARDPD
jgi:hypothetical protein